MFGDNGFEVNGDRNVFWDNVAEENDGSGWVVKNGDDNEFYDNIAEENVLDGFDIASNGNRLEGNEAKKNRINGFRVSNSATGNTFEDNEAEENDVDGFFLDGTTSGRTRRRRIRRSLTT